MTGVVTGVVTGRPLARDRVGQVIVAAPRRTAALRRL